MNQKIYVAVGLPASGKTTWAKKFIAENPYHTRVNKDDLRMMLNNGNYSKESEELIREAQDGIILVSLARGYSVIVDNTNLKSEDVERIKAVATIDSNRAEVIIQDFTHVSIDECIRRDASRDKPVGGERIREMWEMYWVEQGNKKD
jgi:predicted kinase